MRVRARARGRARARVEVRVRARIRIRVRARARVRVRVGVSRAVLRANCAPPMGRWAVGEAVLSQRCCKSSSTVRRRSGSLRSNPLTW